MRGGSENTSNNDCADRGARGKEEATERGSGEKESSTTVRIEQSAE